MLRALLLLVPALFLLISCQPSDDKAQRLIEQAIKAHGGDAWQNKQIAFNFRDYHLVLAHQNGHFHYERTHRDSTGTTVREVLTNESFRRTLNGRLQILDTTEYGRYSRAVNSVAYFVLLPFKLRDPAVQAQHVGESTVDGQRYDKVRVRFRADGGGKDHGDTFYYWFNQKTHTMDYLAYSEGGARFRKAINPVVVGGIRFQDYINYQGAKGDTSSVEHYDQKYTAGKLTELSRIEQKNLLVTTLP